MILHMIRRRLYFVQVREDFKPCHRKKWGLSRLRERLCKIMPRLRKSKGKIDRSARFRHTCAALQTTSGAR